MLEFANNYEFDNNALVAGNFSSLCVIDLNRALRLWRRGNGQCSVCCISRSVSIGQRDTVLCIHKLRCIPSSSPTGV
jgi:hypothetical protein